MKIELDKKKLTERFIKEFPDIDTGKLMVCLIEAGLPLQLSESKGLIFKDQEFKIELVGDDIPMCCDFRTEIPGINDVQVLNVKVPTFDSSKQTPFVLSVDYIPFGSKTLTNIMRKKNAATRNN